MNLQEVFEREVAKYPRALSQRIVEIGTVTKSGGGMSGGRWSHRVPVQKHRTLTYSCGHGMHETVGGREVFNKARKVGVVVTCDRCALEWSSMLSVGGFVEKLAVRTRAPWTPLFRGNVYDYDRVWREVRPLLRAEVQDERLDELLAACVGWDRIAYESEAARDARRCELLPEILRATLRDPVQEVTT